MIEKKEIVIMSANFTLSTEIGADNRHFIAKAFVVRGPKLQPQLSNFTDFSLFELKGTICKVLSCAQSYIHSLILCRFPIIIHYKC